MTDTGPIPTGRYNGRVKWFNPKFGYGFIVSNSDEGDVTGDIFVYHDGIVVSQEQYRYLVAGEYVSFSLAAAGEDSQHKYVAVDVRGVDGGKLMCETRKEMRDSRPIRTESGAGAAGEGEPAEGRTRRSHQRPSGRGGSRGRGRGQRGRGRSDVAPRHVRDEDGNEWRLVPARGKQSVTRGGQRGRGGRGGVGRYRSQTTGYRDAVQKGTSRPSDAAVTKPELSEEQNVPDFLRQLTFAGIVANAERNAERTGNVTLHEDGSCVFDGSAVSWETMRDLLSENAPDETQWCRVSVINRTNKPVAVQVPHKMIDAFFVTRASADSPPLSHGQKVGNLVFRFWTHGQSLDELRTDTVHPAFQHGLFLTCAAKYHSPFILLSPNSHAIMLIGFFPPELRTQCQAPRTELPPERRTDTGYREHFLAERISFVIYGCDDEPDKFDRRNVIHYYLDTITHEWINARQKDHFYYKQRFNGLSLG